MSSNEFKLEGERPQIAISRSQIEDFIRCPRCFVLEVKHGVRQPPRAPFTLNLAVEAQLKKELDGYRQKQTVPPIVAEAGLDLRPLSHPAMDDWRKTSRGISHNTGVFSITGVMNDVWVDRDGQLVVVEYKATGRTKAVTELGYAEFYDSYRREIEIYQWLLRKNGFEVSNTAYFLYVTATQTEDSFENVLHFESNLIAHEGSSEWIEDVLDQIQYSLDNPEVPVSSRGCEVCRFARDRTLALAKLEEIDELPPHCPVCDEVMSKTVYGMPSGPMATGFVSMGCIMSGDDPEWLCTKCEFGDDAGLDGD